MKLSLKGRRGMKPSLVSLLAEIAAFFRYDSFAARHAVVFLHVTDMSVATVLGRKYVSLMYSSTTITRIEWQRVCCVVSWCMVNYAMQ
jgi:hypothetical protein